MSVSLSKTPAPQRTVDLSPAPTILSRNNPQDLADFLSGELRPTLAMPTPSLFWSDLAEDLKDPTLAAAYETASEDARVPAECLAAMND